MDQHNPRTPTSQSSLTELLPPDAVSKRVTRLPKVFGDDSAELRAIERRSALFRAIYGQNPAYAAHKQ